MFLASSLQAAMLKASLSSADVGTMIGARPGAVAIVVKLRLGDTPGSELAGEPNPPGLALTMALQWNVPGSEGGVKVETTRSTCALAAFGVTVGSLEVVSTCG